MSVVITLDFAWESLGKLSDMSEVFLLSQSNLSTPERLNKSSILPQTLAGCKEIILPEIIQSIKMDNNHGMESERTKGISGRLCKFMLQRHFWLLILSFLRS